MDFAKKLEDIKKLLFNDVAPVVPVAAAKDYTLADGSMVTVPPTDKSLIVTMNGEPAPAADYTLEDGTVIRVDAMGLISEVVAKQVEQAAPNFDAQFSEINAAINTHKQEFSDYKTQAELRFTRQDDIIKKQQEGFTQLLEIVENLSKAPSASPAESSKSSFAQVKGISREEQLIKLQANLKKLQTQQ